MPGAWFCAVWVEGGRVEKVQMDDGQMDGLVEEVMGGFLYVWEIGLF